MPSRALNYVQDKGLTTEAAYPYKAVKGTCSVTSGTYKTKTHASVAATEAGKFIFKSIYLYSLGLIGAL